MVILYWWSLEWDDNQGTDGVWFLRNSWGDDWGEDGYMLIEYGCCSVGYAACYIEYSGTGDNLVEETKHANQYSDKDNWWSWSTHGMHCDNYWYGGPDYIYYEFDVPNNSPGPILIGVEFKADIGGLNYGPDLEVKDPASGNWYIAKQSMGGPNSLVWKWYNVLNEYISSSDKLEFRILCAWGCHAYLDDVGVRYAEPVPILDCTGSLSWTDVIPGSTVTGDFTVENIGDPGSLYQVHMVRRLPVR